jgi:hypothetical protein
VKFTVAIIALWLCVVSASVVRAMCVGVSVNSFSADGDGNNGDIATIEAVISLGRTPCYRVLQASNACLGREYR